MIFKVQVPLFPQQSRIALVYDESKQFIGQVPFGDLPEHVIKAAQARPNGKVYWEANLVGRDLHWFKQVSDCKW